MPRPFRVFEFRISIKIAINILNNTGPKDYLHSKTASRINHYVAA